MDRDTLEIELVHFLILSDLIYIDGDFLFTQVQVIFIILEMS